MLNAIFTGHLPSGQGINFFLIGFFEVLVGELGCFLLHVGGFRWL